MKKNILIGLFFPFFFSGCATTLDAVRSVDSSPPPISGAPYNLSFTQFKVVVTRRVDQCERPASDEEIKTGSPKIIREAKVKVSAEVTPSEQRDPLRTYVIDLTSLQSFFKSTEVKVAYYDTGVIKSINATAEDKSAEFVAKTAQTIAKIASVAIGEKGGPPGQETCKDDITKIVNELKKKQEDLEFLTEKLEFATEQLKQITAIKTSLGKALSRDENLEIGKRTRALIRLQNDQRHKQIEIKKDLEAISVVDSITWPKDGETLISDKALIKAIDEKTQNKWFGKTGMSFIPDTAVFLNLVSVEPIGRTASCGKSCPDDAVPGIKYRMPAMGVLILCSAIKPNSTSGQLECDQGERISKPAMISQLGRVFVLPLKSTLFSTKTISASFSETGTPTMLGATSSAASDKASTALTGLVDAAASINSTRAQKEAADLESKIKILKLQKELADATAALAPPSDQSKQDATATYSVDTALINAELANIQAKKALDEIKNTN